MSKHLKNYYLPIFLILVLSFSRIIPHPPNFSPILATGIFAGFLFKKIFLAAFVVILSMFLGDLYLGLHNQMIFVYIGLLVSTFFGHYLKNFKVFTVLSIGLVGSLCFFLITNFGAWLILDVYEKNFNDLLKAYILAIPFFHNTLISTFLYLIVFKLIFEFATIKKIIKYPL